MEGRRPGQDLGHLTAHTHCWTGAGKKERRVGAHPSQTARAEAKVGQRMKWWGKEKQSIRSVGPKWLCSMQKTTWILRIGKISSTVYYS